MIEDLRKNIELEKKIISQISIIQKEVQTSKEKIYLDSLNSLVNQLKMLNNSIPGLLKQVSAAKKLDEPRKNPNIERLTYTSPITKETNFLSLNKSDKKSFIQELKVSESALSGMRKRQEQVTEKKPSKFIRASNIVFSRIADKLAIKSTDLAEDMRKANIPLTTSTYISISFFSTFLAFTISMLIYITAVIISISNITYFYIPLFLTGLTGFLFYIYPSSEKGSVQKKISQELPFVTIHMAAIAGSNVEPTKIFKIIAKSPEYPNVSKELKKVITQIELYGYDLVNALKNSAKQTPNSRLAELFSGLATNISSGGDLKTYLQKKADNFLLDYQLERKKYIALSETFMDIYISILITAPLVLMMLFIVMNVSGLSIGFGLDTLLAISIGAISILNIIFLVVVQFKQPAN